MKILVTGGTGLVGSLACKRLEELGHDLVVISRNPNKAEAKLSLSKAKYISWESFYNDGAADLKELQSVINLAGEPLAEGRWSAEKMKRIDDSRGAATQKIIERIKELGIKLESFVSASAMGIYGSRGDEELAEESEHGTGFLADVCKNWEKPVFESAPEISKRQVALRISLVLSDRGGFLGEILPIFSKGVGGPISDGKAWMSWIHQDDLVNLIVACIENENYSGAINASTSSPVRNSEMTSLLGKVLGVPAIIPVPAFGLKMMFGKKAEMLLASAKLRPRKLEDLSFPFEFANLENALRALLKA